MADLFRDCDDRLMETDGWPWDESLYAGAAPFYVSGRVPYPRALIDSLAAELGLNGSGRLLDLGCGPGSLTVPLAGWFSDAVGVDADAGMLAEAASQADAAGVRNTTWVHRRAESLPNDLGSFRLATLAQAFHWMDRPLVARRVRDLLEPDGKLAHVHATTHEGIDTDEKLEYPQPPRAALRDLVVKVLGTDLRAGRSTRAKPAAVGEELGAIERKVYRDACYDHVCRFEIPGVVETRTSEQVIAAVLSLSSSTPNLLGDQLLTFQASMRELLARHSPSGLFSQQMNSIVVDVWVPS